ncbi:LacI family DNA-binding transcriptional regulator [Pseudorhizobium flavum]|uniref:LacI family transcriptional regulator n=1 Tax=Pseudorhizobium flavum TaxID=1335061 RepID=A0A7W9Z2R7_9HYPH|nr:LacI family DNA-binding transcriptional regulator [Pseudorhizobium flavum]MBB6182474.1 LacI family transcriptional regulator [Pseudorhizobium flavum]CAD6619029.1 LacI family transcriptional regulator [Pseudorhizobium flavum]
MANKHLPVTLRDVAAAAGVDVSTISRVLQNKGRVSEPTRQRILLTAERLGYRGNPVARALKTARSSTILMVVPQIENPIFASAIIGAEIEARSRGFALLVSYDKGDGREIISDVSRSSMIEGVIIASFDEDDRLRQMLATTDLPHVILNRHLPGDDNCVAIDTQSAARMGVEHLIAMGHRRIGHLAGRLGRFNGDMRRRGWQEAMAAAGLEHGDELVVQAGYSPEDVPDAVDRLLSAGVTAIHAATLLTAAAAIARLHERGLRVPEDVSVVTMHDDLLARVVYPQVSTVCLPSQEMGRVAVRRLIDLIGGSLSAGASEGSVLLPPGELIVRASVAPL